MNLRITEKCLVFLLAVLLSFPVFPFAAAAEDDPGEESEAAADYTLNGKTWDELIAEFYESHNLETGNASFGYYNTVTGETHYYDEDRWYIGASIYKLPLGMLYAEMLKSGKTDLKEYIWGYQLEDLLYGMIVDSNNEYAEYLWRNIGGYQAMRKGFLKYFEMDEETAEPIYWRNNYFTTRQMLTCLKHLYEDSETYAPIIDLMLIASPNKNFKYKEQKFEVAHKYGYVPEFGSNYYNDTAICYTDDPICIVMLTMDIPKPSSVLADFCTLACDYAQSSRVQRLEAEEKARIAEEEARAAEEQRLAEEKAAAEKLAEEQRLEAERKAEEARIEAERLAEAEAQAEARKRSLVIAFFGADAVLLAAVMVIKIKKNKK